MARIKSIQLLRAVSTLGIVYYHCTYDNSYRFPISGFFCVDIFFIISGFITAYTISINTDKFLIKRIIRIVPLYTLATLIMVLTALIFPGLLRGATVNISGLIKSLLFIPYPENANRGHPILGQGWALNFEVFFYHIMFLCIIFVKNKKYITVICAFALVLFVVLLNILNLDIYIFTFYQWGYHLEIVYGLLLYHLYIYYNQKIKMSKKMLILFIFIALITMIYLILDIHISNNRIIFYGIPSLILVAALLAMEKYIPGNLIVKFGIILGDASYAMYLFHLFVICFLSRVIYPQIFDSNSSFFIELIKLFIALSLTIVFSILINEFVDKPIQVRLRKTIKKYNENQITNS
jgi:peptidoglycan/LPS O-acetylase OafA/YrhL